MGWETEREADVRERESLRPPPPPPHRRGRERAGTALVPHSQPRGLTHVAAEVATHRPAEPVRPKPEDMACSEVREREGPETNKCSTGSAGTPLKATCLLLR